MLIKELSLSIKIIIKEVWKKAAENFYCREINWQQLKISKLKDKSKRTVIIRQSSSSKTELTFKLRVKTKSSVCVGLVTWVRLKNFIRLIKVSALGMLKSPWSTNPDNLKGCVFSGPLMCVFCCCLAPVPASYVLSLHSSHRLWKIHASKNLEGCLTSLPDFMKVQHLLQKSLGAVQNKNKTEFYTLLILFYIPLTTMQYILSQEILFVCKWLHSVCIYVLQSFFFWIVDMTSGLGPSWVFFFS